MKTLSLHSIVFVLSLAGCSRGGDRAPALAGTAWLLRNETKTNDVPKFSVTVRTELHFGAETAEVRSNCRSDVTAHELDTSAKVRVRYDRAASTYEILEAKSDERALAIEIAPVKTGKGATESKKISVKCSAELKPVKVAYSVEGDTLVLKGDGTSDIVRLQRIR